MHAEWKLNVERVVKVVLWLETLILKTTNNKGGSRTMQGCKESIEIGDCQYLPVNDKQVGDNKDDIKMLHTGNIELHRQLACKVVDELILLKI